MSPKRSLSEYDVYVLYRGKKAATATGEKLGQETMPDTFDFKGKTFHWSGLDMVLSAIVFSEVDPRVSR